MSFQPIRSGVYRLYNVRFFLLDVFRNTGSFFTIFSVLTLSKVKTF